MINKTTKTKNLVQVYNIGTDIRLTFYMYNPQV